VGGEDYWMKLSEDGSAANNTEYCAKGTRLSLPITSESRVEGPWKYV
jgi:hypothetical protein